MHILDLGHARELTTCAIRPESIHPYIHPDIRTHPCTRVIHLPQACTSPHALCIPRPHLPLFLYFLIRLYIRMSVHRRFILEQSECELCCRVVCGDEWELHRFGRVRPTTYEGGDKQQVHRYTGRMHRYTCNCNRWHACIHTLMSMILERTYMRDLRRSHLMSMCVHACVYICACMCMCMCHTSCQRCDETCADRCEQRQCDETWMIECVKECPCA